MNNLTIDLNYLSQKQIHEIYQSMAIINNEEPCLVIEKFWLIEGWDLENLRDRFYFKKQAK